MSMEQCHSTVGENAVVKPRSAGHTQVGTTGRAYWRSLDDLSDTPQFRDWLEKEFPTDASRLLETSRRTFLKIMGASVALAGAATIPGCRRPDHKIYPYSQETPEDIIPGKPLFFATSVALPGGSVEGVLCETHEGRPTKIEGNPLHPSNQGRSSAWAQACILGLYDPDRLKDPVFTRASGDGADQTPRSWADFAGWWKLHGAKIAGDKGSRLAVIVDKRRSMARQLVKARVMKAFPGAVWVAYDPTESMQGTVASAAAFGAPHRESLRLDQADVIVSLDRDFLFDDPAMVANTRGFSARRKVLSTADTMSRLYMVESGLSVTGTKADHRLGMPASHIPAFAVALARRLMGEGGVSAPALKAAVDRVSLPTGVSIDAAFVDALAKDLLADEAGKSRAGRTLIVAGPTQPAPVHALALALNAALGNLGKTVQHFAMSEDEASDGVAGLRMITDGIRAGRIDTVIVVGANPAYDAPGDIDFAGALKALSDRGGTIIAATCPSTETAAHAHWRLPMSHDLESWGDLESVDGVVSPVQPMIAPLYASKTDTEILDLIAGATPEQADAHAIAKAALAPRQKNPERDWRRGLFDGVLLRREPARAAPSMERLAALVGGLTITPATSERIDVVFAMGQVRDGSMTNNGWLQELPDPITKIVWDNVAMVSRATAERLGCVQSPETDQVQRARMVNISVGGERVAIPAWVVPGIPDNTMIVQLGYGRTSCGHVGEGCGSNVYPISGLNGSNRRLALGAAVERAGEGERWRAISSTQTHGSMEGRSIVREVDLPAWKRFGDDPFKGLSEAEKKKLQIDNYGNARDLNFAERLGEMAHTPASINAYIHPQRGTKDSPGPDGTAVPVPAPMSEHGSAAWRKHQYLNKPVDFASSPQWGMSIDQTTCTGCSACMVACQAENNIPIVGKEEVAKGREMHWIRIDRYFSGETENNKDLTVDSVVHQAVMCVHCENAPCETVCPVNATVHGPSGLNYMVYNRCIGTRYCANNCPYKVRRFNFFEWGTRKFNGGFIGKDALDAVGAAPANENWVPPRLRERVDEITAMRNNPNVTVRSRGVMEKCTYCVQRLNEARISIKLRNLEFIPDGFVQTACQQACPADAIAFGDILDITTEYPVPGGGKRVGSKVHNERENQRTYLLLGYLNTRPRTTHMVAMRNPNPALVVDAKRKHRWDHPFEHGHGEDGGHGHDHGGHGEPGPAKGAAPGAQGMFIDPSRPESDRGYRLSLAVLGAHA
jgi:molybdopterin-containing oxidoreductase family iron-sulfur binding subunit